MARTKKRKPGGGRRKNKKKKKKKEEPDEILGFDTNYLSTKRKMKKKKGKKKKKKRYGSYSDSFSDNSDDGVSDVALKILTREEFLGIENSNKINPIELLGEKKEEVEYAYSSGVISPDPINENEIQFFQNQDLPKIVPIEERSSPESLVTKENLITNFSHIDSSKYFALEEDLPPDYSKEEKNVKKNKIFEILKKARLEKTLKVQKMKKRRKDNEDFNFIKIREIKDKTLSDFHPFKGKEYSNIPGIQLHQEIVDLYDFLKETKEERIVRSHIFGRVKEILLSLSDKCTVSIFGSFATSTMLPGSDLDIQVRLPFPRFGDGERRKYAVRFLKKVEMKMKKSRFARDFRIIESARVPLLSCKDAMSGQPLDISVCMTSLESSIENVLVVKKFSEIFPSFNYLTMVIKLFLKQRGLNNVYTGGLSSFGISLLVISHLQHHETNIVKEKRKVASLGTLLLDFFALYGKYFNYLTTAIDVNNGGKYMPKSKLIKDFRENPFSYRLFIVDPSDENNIVTKGSFHVDMVRDAFNHAFEMLLVSEKECKEKNFLLRIININDDLLRRAKEMDKIRETINV